ncbi:MULTISPECIES: hypothetical protein [unclassified Halomonas]|nr:MULTISPECIES: hypothetical protein [unclassified Halomonas]
MNQRWLLIGLVSLSPALVEVSWREHLFLGKRGQIDCPIGVVFATRQ